MFRFSFIVLLIGGLLLGGCDQITTVEPDRQLVIVQGTGEVEAVPDIFSVRAVATRRGKQVEALRQEVDRQVASVLELADRLGIDEKDVNARELQVMPEWQYQPERRLVGYQARRPVEIRVHSLAIFAQLMSGLTAAGITEINPQGAGFSNLKALERDALKQAVEDAREKALVLAKAAGRTLGPAVQITEQGGGHSPVRMTMERTDQPGDYRAGEERVRQQVEVRFALD